MKIEEVSAQSKNQNSIVLRLCFPLMGGYEAELLEKKIDLLLSRGIRDLRLDLSRLEGINGYGILLLFHTLETTQKAKSSFCLLNPSPAIRDTLCRFKLGALLPIEYVKDMCRDVS